MIFLIAICTRKCKNGGSCVAPNTCSCQPGFTADNCQIGTGIDTHFRLFNLNAFLWVFAACSSILSILNLFLSQIFVLFPVGMEESARQVLVFACLDGLVFLVINVSRNGMKCLYLLISIRDSFITKCSFWLWISFCFSNLRRRLCNGRCLHSAKYLSLSNWILGKKLWTM